jgi:tripartite-type tricarboxylate transporter receptor subunit TctC
MKPSSTAGRADDARAAARAVARCAAAAMLAAGAVTAAAQTSSADKAAAYPVKPVRIVVASTAGGGTDFVARFLASRLTEPLGQQVLVDNRPGGGSKLGYEHLVRSAPDGYTLAMITASYTINPALYALKYDPLHDFTPVARIARGPYVVVVHPSLPVRGIKELVALARARPNQINYGTSGTGTIVHLTTELFLYMANVKMTHIPYKGGGPALTDLIAGQIQLVFATSQTGLAQARAGRVRALAVTTPERVSAAPELPTVSESGVPGYVVTNWHALIAPKGLPRPILDQLNAEVNKALRAKDAEERLKAEGVSPVGGTPEQLYEEIRKELEQWRLVVQRAGVKVD